MNDLTLALMCGIDIPIPDIQITIHQPTIKEIAYLGEKSFFSAVECLLADKKILSQGKIDLGAINNFQIFMTIMGDESQKVRKDAVINLLQILFPNYKISFSPQSVFCLCEEKTVVLDEVNFDIFQSYLKEIFCFKPPDEAEEYNPGNKKAQEIAEKLLKGRKRAAELKGQANVSVFSQYLSCLAVGLKSMSLAELSNLTMFQLYDLVERYSLYMNWDIGIRSRLAGSDDKDELENWMKNIH